ncbi:MAG: beta-ketoacyl-[acyl-carrier-protein] synthase II, partial [Stomatobaculum longum]|nr:beta-ketoacyl-[acyl-carrier-protein] synthase II [Stomatobaculum longum]
MEKRRVVVTGLGAVTAIGIGAEAFWNSLKAGQVGIDRITQFDTEKFKVKLAAEVKDFKAADFMDVKSARRMERFSQFAVAAAKEALADSGLDLTKEDPYMAGCAIGSGIGSLQSVEREYNRMITKGPNMVNPLFVPMMISNMAAGNVAIQCGLKGKNINIVTACASGTHNVGEAFRTIAHGDADIMLA